MRACLHGRYNAEKEEEERRAVVQRERLARLEEQRAADQAKAEAEEVSRSCMNAAITSTLHVIHVNVCYALLSSHISRIMCTHTHTYCLESCVRRRCIAASC
jgi:hypothetical protein